MRIRSTQLDEQADALIGYFVDQARRSGASWNQIGGAMGVSKQAAQKRFVPTKAADLMPEGVKPFSRFTDRALRVVDAAGRLAAPAPVGGAHLAAGLFCEPMGLAAKAIAAAGLTPEQVYTALGTGPAPAGPDASVAALLGLVVAGGQVTDTFAGLGLSPQRAEELLAAELAAYQAGRKSG